MDPNSMQEYKELTNQRLERIESGLADINETLKQFLVIEQETRRNSRDIVELKTLVQSLDKQNSVTQFRQNRGDKVKLGSLTAIVSAAVTAALAYFFGTPGA